jgi:hypothetical protein
MIPALTYAAADIGCADAQRRIIDALDLIVTYGGADGAHHKDWVLDQVARKLAGPHYEALVADARAGEDGPATYNWDCGVAP